MKNNSYVIEGAYELKVSSKRTYIHISKTDYNFILENTKVRYAILSTQT